METIVEVLMIFFRLTVVFAEITGIIFLVFFGPMIAVVALFLVPVFLIGAIISLVEWIRTPKAVRRARALANKAEKENEEAMRITRQSALAASYASPSGGDSSSGSSSPDSEPNNNRGPGDDGPRMGYGSSI